MTCDLSELIICLVTAFAMLGNAVQAEVSARVKVLYAEEISEMIQDSDVTLLARLVWGEARGLSTTEQAAVIWCVLNRVDAGYADGTIRGVVTAKGQFTGYHSSNPVTDFHRDLAIDVLSRWYREQHGETDVGRILPPEYLYFAGSGGHNWFRPAYKSSVRWDWSLPSPYDD